LTLHLLIEVPLDLIDILTAESEKSLAIGQHNGLLGPATAEGLIECDGIGKTLALKLKRQLLSGQQRAFRFKYLKWRYNAFPELSHRLPVDDA
jgi:hypothetical protein